MQTEIIIRKKKLDTVFYTLVSLTFVLTSLFMALIPYRIPMWAKLLLLCLPVPFFSFCSIVFIMELFNRRPLLLVDNKGITDFSSATSIGFIPWADVDQVFLLPYLGQTFISVTLFDDNKYLSKMKKPQRKACLSILDKGFPLVNISLAGTGQNPQKVYQQILEQYGDSINFY